MIRFVMCLCLVFAPTILHAETIILKSGEHEGYSRLFLKLDTPRNWVFGRVSGGYELRTDVHETEFDLSRVYDFIPYKRILDVTSLGPGRLFVAVTCRCRGNVYEIREGLVLDIRDGAPGRRSRFETQLAELAQGISWFPEQSRTETPNAELEMADFGIPVFRDLALAVEQAAMALSQVQSPELPLKMTDYIEPEMAPLHGFSMRVPDFPAIMGAGSGELPELGAADLTLRNPPPEPMVAAIYTAPADSDQKLPTSPDVPKMNRRVAEVEPPAHENTVPFLPKWTPDLTDAMPTGNDRVAFAEQALLAQLSRAAAQGLISVDLPEITKFTPMVGEPGEQSYAAADAAEEMAEADEILTEPASDEHMRVETAIDRDVTVDAQGQILTSAGQICLSGENFDVAAWGHAAGPKSPFGELRGKLVGEFDRPDAQIIQQLARRYIYLGFGAEAQVLLKAFAVEISDSRILIEMAEVMDHGFVAGDGAMAAQISCATGAAMWAVLAKKSIPAGGQVDTKVILRTFSGLPLHLRSHLGPWLSQRFLNYDDPTTATTIRDMIDRAPGERGAQFELIQARLAGHAGDIDKALQRLRNVVADDGPSAPVALVELINSSIAANRPVSTSAAKSADALAVEYRGTEMGRRLTRAAIRGFAVSGNVETTFQRIDTAVGNGDMADVEAEQLRAEAHVRNALDSSDTTFLRMAFKYGLRATEVSAEARAARSQIAARLIGLGFPEKAESLLSAPGHEPASEERLLLAQAAIIRQDPDTAIALVSDLEDAEALLVKARANELQNNFDSAAMIFASLSMSAAHESAAWRAGDWQAVAAIDTSPYSDAAQLMLAARPATVGAESESGSPADVDDLSMVQREANPKPIAAGKGLLVQSQATRKIIADLLNLQ